MPRAAIVCLLALAGALLLCGPASADLASLTAACAPADAADDDTANGAALPYRFCDDGVPDQGGRTPNPGAVKAIAVPQSYAGVEGLPAKAPAQPGTGADAAGDVALDVDLALPDPGRFPKPAAGYPLIVFMHGCCAGNKTSWESPRALGSGEKWKYNSAYFAARGYVAVTYTARGFVSSVASGSKGSTGETQIDDARYEMNDFQHLTGQLADDPALGIDASNVVATGGSYGGGFAWMALTDPTWTSPGGRPMALRAVAPRYGWTDLVESLVPNGDDRDRLPAFDGSETVRPLGFAKRSILAALFGSGQLGFPTVAVGSQATFPPAVAQAFACLQSADPYETNPLCGETLQVTLPEFARYRSAFYQQRYFDRLAAGDAAARVPVFSAGTFTDQLFPNEEHRRMVERLKATSPGYPVQEHYGDYQHFTQNKAKEWGDVCGGDRHVCTLADFPGGDLDAEPAGRVRVGVHSRLSDFLDHYVKPPANPSEPAPAFDVTASVQACPETAGQLGVPADEPGPEFTAASFGALAPHTLRARILGTQTTTNKAVPNQHALRADPIFNQAANGASCVVETDPAGPGVATYDSAPLERTATMLGRTRVTVAHQSAGTQLQLTARLYDVRPDGSAILVDRGLRRIADGQGDGFTNVDLHGNGWRFDAGHKLRLEIAQDDDPYIRGSNVPSSMTLTGIALEMPIREGDVALPPVTAAGPPAAGCKPRRGFASVSARSRGGGLRIALRRLQARPVVVDVFRQSRGRRVIGNRLVARFRGRTGAFGWNGRSRRAGRGVGDGAYFVRFRMTLADGGTDTRRVTLRRAHGRFRGRPAFHRRASCGTISFFKLGSSVFGGRDGARLGVAFRLGVPARTTLTLLRGGRKVRTLRTAQDPARRKLRLSLRARGLRRGDYRVRLRVQRAGGEVKTATLTARRL